jgi:hypothetical protein
MLHFAHYEMSLNEVSLNIITGIITHNKRNVRPAPPPQGWDTSVRDILSRVLKSRGLMIPVII